MENTVNWIKQQGFSLIELIIAIAVISVLTAIAMPAYTAYSSKAKFTATTNAATSRKSAVMACIVTLKATRGCTAGTNGIPANTAVNARNGIPRVAVANGRITATSPDTGSYTYILTPTYNNATGAVTWAVTGTCRAQGIC